MRSNIKWIIIFAAVCAFSLGIWLLRSNEASDSRIARVELNGELLREIDLNAVTAPYEFEVDAENGSNTVRVEHGRIAVTDADCPDKICVNTVYIENGVVPIVCLPHRLTVTIQGSGSGFDAVAGDK